MRPDQIGPRRLRPATQDRSLFPLVGERRGMVLKGVVLPSVTMGQMNGVTTGARVPDPPQPALVLTIPTSGPAAGRYVIGAMEKAEGKTAVPGWLGRVAKLNPPVSRQIESKPSGPSPSKPKMMHMTQIKDVMARTKATASKGYPMGEKPPEDKEGDPVWLREQDRPQSEKKQGRKKLDLGTAPKMDKATTVPPITITGGPKGGVSQAGSATTVPPITVTGGPKGGVSQAGAKPAGAKLAGTSAPVSTPKLGSGAARPQARKPIKAAPITITGGPKGGVSQGRYAEKGMDKAKMGEKLGEATIGDKSSDEHKKIIRDSMASGNKVRAMATVRYLQNTKGDKHAARVAHEAGHPHLVMQAPSHHKQMSEWMSKYGGSDKIKLSVSKAKPGKDKPEGKKFKKNPMTFQPWAGKIKGDEGEAQGGFVGPGAAKYFMKPIMEGKKVPKEKVNKAFAELMKASRNFPDRSFASGPPTVTVTKDDPESRIKFSEEYIKDHKDQLNKLAWHHEGRQLHPTYKVAQKHKEAIRQHKKHIDHARAGNPFDREITWRAVDKTNEAFEAADKLNRQKREKYDTGYPRLHPNKQTAQWHGAKRKD